MRFPTARGANLLRRKVILPDDLSGDLNVVLVAFQQWQQSQVDTWLPYLEDLEQTYAGICYYELPVIRQMNWLSRTFINEGMRAGIPNSKARERTITLYLDKKSFREILGLPHEQNIFVLLLDRQGQILWKTEGAFTLEQGEDLKAMVDRSSRPTT